jgi:F-type H+-transporting ATPase subunit c
LEVSDPRSAKGLAMIESIAIYCFVVAMILIFANPFWSYVIAHAVGK